MTIKQLMNAANVTPDVAIDVFDRRGDLIFSDLYENRNAYLASLEVCSFRVERLCVQPHRTDIDSMTIYLD